MNLKDGHYAVSISANGDTAESNSKFKVSIHAPEF